MTASGTVDSSGRSPGASPRVRGMTEGKVSLLRALLLTTPLIILVTIGLGSVSALGSLLDSDGRFQHRCARVWSRLVLSLAPVRLEVEGLDSLRVEGTYVFCANHQSYMDIPVLLAALPFQFRFAAKKQLFQVPFLGWHLRRTGHIPVDRDNPFRAMRALGRSVDPIRHGVPVVVFPEGRRSPDGTTGVFKGGAFRIAKRSGAETVPISIRGTRQILPQGSKHIRAGDVKVTIHPSIASNTLSPEEIALAVRRAIVGPLEDKIQNMERQL